MLIVEPAVHADLEKSRAVSKAQIFAQAERFCNVLAAYRVVARAYVAHAVVVAYVGERNEVPAFIRTESRVEHHVGPNVPVSVYVFGARSPYTGFLVVMHGVAYAVGRLSEPDVRHPAHLAVDDVVIVE